MEDLIEIIGNIEEVPGNYGYAEYSDEEKELSVPFIDAVKIC